MVSSELTNEVAKLLGERTRNYLITGGSGFVGSHLARCLAEAGNSVTVLSRNRYRTHRILHPNIRFIKGDVTSLETVVASCRDQEVVFHAAALSSPWGNPSDFERVNVEGTRNVIQACLQASVQRLVHVSSTSVFFNYRDLVSHTDDSPYAVPQACHYSDSKRRAEELVQAAIVQGLNAFTVRARAVFGPGDTALLPRLILAARDGRLRQIGDGQNLVDLTYVDNLVLALVMASVRGNAGGVCTVTNDEPIKLWELLPKIFTQLSIPYSGKQVAYPIVQMATRLQETLHRLLPKLGEPKLTSYTAGLLAKHQVFDQTAAKQQLGFVPIVSMKSGIDRTLEHLVAKEDAPARTAVQLRCFSTGYATGNHRIVERTAPTEHIRFHALVGLIEHPVYGLTLFDTGYSKHLKHLRGAASYIFNHLLPTHTCDSLSIASQLRALSIEPNDVQRIVISHFHPDHIAGLRDFPQAEFIASQSAWQAIRNRKGVLALRSAFLPGLLPDDFAARLHLIESYSDPGMGPFDRCHDLFGDRSVRLFELPGHAAGQMGALIQTHQSREFLVADAAWTSSAIRTQAMPQNLTRSFIHNFRHLKATLRKLKDFSDQYPEMNLIPTHCPEVAQRFDFDRQVDELLR